MVVFNRLVRSEISPRTLILDDGAGIISLYPVKSSFWFILFLFAPDLTKAVMARYLHFSTYMRLSLNFSSRRTSNNYLNDGDFGHSLIGTFIGILCTNNLSFDSEAWLSRYPSVKELVSMEVGCFSLEVNVLRLDSKSPHVELPLWDPRSSVSMVINLSELPPWFSWLR